MEIDDGGDLILRTYYMVDWKKAGQSPSDDRCVTCGNPMLRAEPVPDRSGALYGGWVCHTCKTVYWLKES